MFKNVVKTTDIGFNAQSLKTLRGKGAAVCQSRGVDCMDCVAAEIPDTSSKTQRLLQMPQDISGHEIMYQS